MGAETLGTLHFRGKAWKGTAHLETDELLFRGGFRLAIPYREIRDLQASHGRLSVTFSGGTAVFDLGGTAEVWAEKIRNPRGLLDKLGVRAGSTAVLLNVPDRDFRAQLVKRGVRITARSGRGESLIFLGVTTPRDLLRLPALAAHLRPDGAVWVVALRGSTVIREADVLAAGKPAGLVDVKVVRFSGTHTAHKFVIPVSRRPRLARLSPRG